MASDKIALLIPVYNEQANLHALYDSIIELRRKESQIEFQVLFIDDGSRDGSIQIIRELASRDGKVGYLELSRNFGKEAALSAGIRALQEPIAACIMMDADLQHPAQVIPQMIAAWRSGAEIVSTKRIYEVEQPWLRKLSSRAFYFLLNKISETPILADSTDFRLLDRKVIGPLKELTEHNRMVRGLVDWLGFKKVLITFVAPERHSGEASYGPFQRLRLAMHAILGFSLWPLKVAGYSGILVLMGSLGLLVAMLLDRLLFDYFHFSNLAFVVVINSLMMGVVLICLGLIALYIGNIHTEVQNRPLFIIKDSRLPEDR